MFYRQVFPFGLLLLTDDLRYHVAASAQEPYAEHWVFPLSVSVCPLLKCFSGPPFTFSHLSSLPRFYTEYVPTAVNLTTLKQCCGSLNN